MQGPLCQRLPDRWGIRRKQPRLLHHHGTALSSTLCITDPFITGSCLPSLKHVVYVTGCTTSHGATFVQAKHRMACCSVQRLRRAC